MGKSRKIRICLVAVFLFVCMAGCGGYDDRVYIDFRDTGETDTAEINPNAAVDPEKPLRIAVCPVLSQQNTIDAYRLLSDHISEKLGRETVLLERKSYAEINVLLANGGADIAFLASGAYTSYTGIEDIEPLVTPVRFGVPYYYSYIIVPKDSSAQNLQDLRGKTFAFTDPLSFSGYLVPIHMLNQINEKPEGLFSNYIFTYSHEKALQAVANKIVDGGAIGSHVYSESKETKDGIADKVRIVAASEKCGIGPVVARKNLGEKDIKILKEVFLNMHKETGLAGALESLLVDRYDEPQPELYDFQRYIIHQIGSKE